jgi:hypothetical protein
MHAKIGYPLNGNMVSKVMFPVSSVGIFAAMLRAIAAIGLIGLLFSNVFLKSFVFLDFKINQEVIS